MTKISNFRINTHFTALKQLPNPYRINLNFAGGSFGFVLGQTLAQGTVTVPSGAYVENATIKTSFDGNLTHVAHEIFFYANNNVNQRILFTLNQISSSQYRFKVTFSNTSGETANLPAFTSEAVLRLAISPFSY